MSNVTCACPHCGQPMAVSVTPAPNADRSNPSNRRDAPHDTPAPHQQRRPDRSTAPAPMSLERAASFRMPFGKHKGSTVADVAKKDHSWLAWFAANGDEGSAKRAIAYYLEHA